MDWQRFASRNGGKCFTFRHPRNEAERQGQVDAIRSKGRIYRFAVQWVAMDSFVAMDRAQRVRFHRTVRPFDPRRV
jgi:hypothetical protein